MKIFPGLFLAQRIDKNQKEVFKKKHDPTENNQRRPAATSRSRDGDCTVRECC